MTCVEIERLCKRFGDVTAVDEATIRIESGEFLAVVGPTGSGKTTLLRLIAGLEVPDTGEIRFDGERMNAVPPHQRRVRMVFQDYALYPHMRVFREHGDSNLGFPLRLHGVRDASLRETVERLAERLGIPRRLFPRRPRELSAGEKQRVAFGRALALPPRLLLLDEPFSNLDALSRIRARNELLAERTEHPVTTIYVTHNLPEAFAMADRIAIMDEGRLARIGTPDEIRQHPASPWIEALLRSADVS